MSREIYWIGGSPCCGKSTITELLTQNYGFHYYKCDDYLEKYLQIAAERDMVVSKRLSKLSIDETFLRAITEQVEDEFAFYDEIFEIILEDLQSIDSEIIIVEGAALLPTNVIRLDIKKDNYIAMVPTKEFQMEQYSKREWVEHYLSECSDSKKAFQNWMKRDIEFAKEVKEMAEKNGFKTIVVDGAKSINDNYEIVKNHFKL